MKPNFFALIFNSYFNLCVHVLFNNDHVEYRNKNVKVKGKYSGTVIPQLWDYFTTAIANCSACILLVID